MLYLTVDPGDPDPDTILEAARAIGRGALVVLPTDTLYGLTADPHNPGAVDALCRLKQRPRHQPLPLIAADLDQIERRAGPLGRLASRLAAAFWPGPLTLLVRAWPDLVPAVHGGGGAVGVRVPDHRVARDLARAAGCPLIATSANLSGEPAVSEASAVAAAISRGVAVVLDAGPTRGGLPSTIVDVRGEVPVLLRTGAVAWDRVLESA